MDTSNNNVVIDDPFNLSQPTPLVYPDISGTNQYTNILLIENAVPDYQKVVDSVNASTLPIVYSIRSKKSDLLALMRANFTTIPRIGFFFTSSSGRTKLFLDKEPLFVDDETVPYIENVQFILNIITEFQVQNIDYLACDTLNYPNWANYYAILTNVGVTVGASNDKTGNIKYGGDWVLESTSQDVEFIYFMESIEYYTYLLDNPAWATTGSNLTGITVYNGYFYVLGWEGRIYKINVNNANDSIVWLSGFTNPKEIVYYNGYFYVTQGASISRINANNPTIWNPTWVTNGSPAGFTLDDTYGITVYNNYIYVVSNYTTHKITKINLDNTSDYSTFATLTIYSRQITYYDNNFYVSCDAGKIIRISTAGVVTDPWVTGIGYHVGGMIGYLNNLYVADPDNGQIALINITNTTTNYSWATSAQGTTYPWTMVIYNNYFYVTNFYSTKIAQITVIPPPLLSIFGTGTINGIGTIYGI